MSSHLRISLLAGAALFITGLSSAALASNITFFQFAADPDLQLKPKELSYSPATGLTAGPGAVSNSSIFSPGLLGTITGGLDGIAPPDPLPAYGFPPTPFYVISDLSLSLSSFLPAGAAAQDASSISQPLTGGNFAISYQSAQGPVLLLSGHTDHALITEKNTGTNASILSGNVHYDAGLLIPRMQDAGLDLDGTFSFALTGLKGTYGLDAHNLLKPFDADATATFDAAVSTPGGPPSVPSPAAVWSGASLLGLLGAARLKKRQANQD